MEKYFADIVIAAVLLLSVLLGAHKGLVKSLAGVVILVAALVGASFIADALAEPVAAWMGPMLEQHIQENLTGTDTADVESMLTALQFGGGELQKMVEDVLQTVQETGSSLLTAVVDSVTHSIAYAAVYVVSFLALLLALWLLVQPLNLAATKLPVVKTVNALGGGVLGLVWGALLVFLAVWAMLRFGWVLTAEMVADSRLLYFFANNSPLSLLARL